MVCHAAVHHGHSDSFTRCGIIYPGVIRQNTANIGIRQPRIFDLDIINVQIAIDSSSAEETHPCKRRGIGTDIVTSGNLSCCLKPSC